MEEIRSSPGAACSRAGEIERDVAQLYHEFSSGLFRYAVVLTANREAAQDAIQEAFLRYFRALSDRRSIEQPRAWLFRVLRNYLLDELKASAVRKEVDIAQLRDYPDSRQDPESDFRLSQILRSLRDVLSPRELECFRLRAVGLSYDEIAEVLDVRPGTVGALLTRAQKKLWSGPPARNGGTPAAGHGGVDTAVAGQRPAPQSPRG